MPPHAIGSFNIQLQSYQQSQQRAKKAFTTDRNEHVEEQISLMKWQVRGCQSQVCQGDPQTRPHLRAGYASPRFKQMESTSSVLERTDKHNQKGYDACFLNFSFQSLLSHLFPKGYRKLMLQ